MEHADAEAAVLDRPHLLGDAAFPVVQRPYHLLDEAEVAVVDCFEEDVLQVQEDVLQDTV